MQFFEVFVLFPTIDVWNYFLAEIWYWFVVAGVYGGIILSGLYRARKYKKCDALPESTEVCYEGGKNIKNN